MRAFRKVWFIVDHVFSITAILGLIVLFFIAEEKFVPYALLLLTVKVWVFPRTTDFTAEEHNRHLNMVSKQKDETIKELKEEIARLSKNDAPEPIKNRGVIKNILGKV